MATIAEILLAKGNAAAANTLQRGNIYADLIRNLSSVPGQVMQQQRALEQDRIKQQIQQQQLQTGQQNLQIGQMDIAAKQRDVDADALAGLLPRTPEGDLDIDKIGEISGSHDPAVVTHAVATAQKLNTAGGAYREQRMRLANLRDEQLGELGLQLKQNPNDLGTFQMIVADGTKSGLIDKAAAPAMLRNAIEQPGFMGQQADAWISRSKEARAASASKIVNVPKDSTPFLQSGTGSGTTFAPLPGYTPKRDTVEVNGQLVDKDTGERIGAPVPKQVEESAIKREWNDYVAQGGKLGFNAYMDMDANRKKPVSITNAANSDAVIAQTAKNIIANPRDLVSIKNVSGMRGEDRMKLFNEIKRLDPTFDVGNVDRQIKFLDSYEDPKGRAALNRGSMNNILQHAADLSAVNQQYQRTNARLLNTPVAALQRQYGTEWQKFATPLAVLKDEIALYFAGGYAPSGEQQKAWDKIINDTATPAQVEQFAKDLIHVGLRRADTANEQFKTMMGYDDPNLITPAGAAAAQQLGMGDAVRKYGSGGRIGTSPSPPVSAPKILSIVPVQ